MLKSFVSALAAVVLITGASEAQAACAVANTFTSGTTAVASQVNQNFADLVNCWSSGTTTFTNGTLAGTTVLPGSGAITSTGNLGVGQSPTYRLDVAGSIDNSATAIGSADAATARVENLSAAAIGQRMGIAYDLGGLARSFIGGYYANYNGPGDVATGLLFATQATAAGGTLERMRIDGSGHVGIGTSLPNAPLHIVGGAGAPSGTTGSIQVGSVGGSPNAGMTLGYVDGAGTGYSYLQSFGSLPLVLNGVANKVGIGTTSPSNLLTVGNASVSGTVAHFQNSTGTCDINPTSTSLSCSSDMRLKRHISPIGASETLAGVLALRPVSYNWQNEVDGANPHTGFVAQDVEKIFPDLVSQGGDGYLTLNYAGFAPYLTAAIHQQEAEIADLKSSVHQLDAANARLREQLENVLTRLGAADLKQQAAAQ